MLSRTGGRKGPCRRGHRKGTSMKRTLCVLLAVIATVAAKKKPPAQAIETPLDRYVSEAHARSAEAPPPTPGSIWQPGSRLSDLARDVRASQMDDVLTIVVAEQASAVVTGATKTQRASSAQSSVAALAGATNSKGALANLANLSGSSQLNGQGTTS